MKKTVVIEVDVETEASNDLIENLLQKFLEQNPFLAKLSFPILVATKENMKAGDVRVRVRNVS